MNVVPAVVDRLVTRVQIHRYEQRQRVEFRRDRDAVERTSMAHHGVRVCGTRPTTA